MTTFRLNGEIVPGGESVLETPPDLRIEVRQTIRLDRATRDVAALQEFEADENDLVEVELENGFILWTSVGQLLRDADAAGTTRRDNGTFPTTYPLQRRGTERGAVDEGIRALRVLGVDLPKHAALKAAEKVEARLLGPDQFFRIDEDGQLTREDPARAGGNAPTLVLIHGTFSSTEGSFNGLFNENADVWKALHRAYEGRVFGFEHRTLTASPIDNALAFLDALPKNANLHLVSHSRGGLVGDLIAFGGVSGDAFPDEDLERELKSAYGEKPRAYEAPMALYRAFNARIAAQSPQVTRFVRVGCPAAGTTLASKRLDIYLSILINLFGKVPALGPLLQAMGEMVAAVAKQRTESDVLPGLQSQMPDSAFIRLLNGSRHVLDSDLTVLAGDSDGFLKNLANLFYWRANDLVVDTRSMYGGARRSQRLWHLEENRHVTHMNYFSRVDTARIVKRGLLREDHDTDGFEVRTPRGVRRGAVESAQPTAHTDRPAVILLPGIMGSNLSVKEGSSKNRVWLDALDLMRGRGRMLALDSGHAVSADSVLDKPYGSIRDDFVRHRLHVMPMPYDWRVSLAHAATALNAHVSARLSASREPVHLLAHSMGGLVASLFMARFPATWASLRERGGRLVQAGTPNYGSYSIPRIFAGDEQVMKMIAMLDLANSQKDWLGWIAEFQGLLELAPGPAGLEPDFSKVGTWASFGARKTPSAAVLAEAGGVRAELIAQADRLAEEGVVYLAGGPEDTPVWFKQEGADAEEIRFTARGDGRVTWDSIPNGLPTWYLPVGHGDLLDARKGFDAVRELVMEGRTSRLSQEPPFASTALRGEPLVQPLLSTVHNEPLLETRPARVGSDDTFYECIPSQEALEAAAVGMSANLSSDEPTDPELAPCRVSIVHGDLRFSKRPLMVGHYRGDPIVHAERVLSNCLDGTLAARHQLGVYPGEAGTADVVLARHYGDPHRNGPTGAIVLGLGNVGELSPGKLGRSVEVGLLRYAQAARERNEQASDLKVSALLVGTSESGIGTAQAMDAVLSAVLSVNRQLRALAEQGGDEPVAPLPMRIADLQFVELYEDIALDALHALATFRGRTGLNINLDLDRRSGGEKRPRATYQPDWWSRVQISTVPVRHDPGGPIDQRSHGLKYTAFGDRARAAISDVVVQRALVDRLVAEAIGGGARADGELPATLFELLVPAGFKEAAADRQRVQLVLDAESAAYPWELLVDRHLGNETAVGIGAGLLRQLRVEQPRAVNHAEDNRVLVVGDPDSAMVALPGAVDEATAVAKFFERRSGWEVVQRIRGVTTDLNATRIIEGLLAQDLRLLHLAGHGVYDADSPMASGMVIGGAEGEAPLLITATEVRQMRVQPELVFINCCHLGRIERTTPFHKLAASLAQAFIEAGSKAVIAAGWPVEDQAAQTFSIEFYRDMLAGEDFGTAVTNARRKTFDRHADSNTWGAYQCYGDPGFRLLMDQGVRARASRRSDVFEEFHDVTEVRIELENLVSRAKLNRGSESVRARTDALWTRCHHGGWLNQRGVLVGFARVHGELRDFPKAIQLYERAMPLHDSGLNVRDLEQLANARVRSATRNSDIEGAIRDLNVLMDEYGQNAERLSLLGSAYKRLAGRYCDVPSRESKTDRDARVRRLQGHWASMVEAYVNAADHREKDWYYPASNALLGIALLGGPWPRAPRSPDTARGLWNDVPWCHAEAFSAALSSLREDLRGREARKFWEVIAETDLAAIEALANDQLESQIPALGIRYRDAIEMYGSHREVGSVVGQWQLADQVLRGMGKRKAADLVATLRQHISGV